AAGGADAAGDGVTAPVQAAVDAAADAATGDVDLAADHVAGLDLAADVLAAADLHLRAAGDPGVAVHGGGAHGGADEGGLVHQADGHDGAVGQRLGDLATGQRDEGVGVGRTRGQQAEADGRGGPGPGHPRHILTVDHVCNTLRGSTRLRETMFRSCSWRVGCDAAGSADAERLAVERGLGVVVADDLDDRVRTRLGVAGATLDLDLDVLVLDRVDAG